MARRRNKKQILGLFSFVLLTMVLSLGGYFVTSERNFDDRGEASAPAVTLDFSASVNSIKKGGRVTLTWTSTGTDRCWAHPSGQTVDWLGSQNVSGSVSLNPESSTHYNLTCGNGNSFISRHLKIVVDDLDFIFRREPTTPVVSGQKVTLIWSAPTADKCWAGPENSSDWIGFKDTSGSQEVTIDTSRNYQLSCRKGDRDFLHTVHVPINDFNIDFNHSGVVLLKPGEPLTLTWSAPEADRCRALGNDEIADWFGAKAKSGSETITPTQGGWYAIRCFKDGKENHRGVTVRIDGFDFSLVASMRNIKKGEGIKLTWAAPTGSECWVSHGSEGWLGSKGSFGSEIIYPERTAHYQMSCYKNGQLARRGVEVIVNNLDLRLTGPSLISRNSSGIASGKLHWGSSNTDFCWMSGSWGGSKGSSSSEIVNPTGTSHYQLNCRLGRDQRSAGYIAIVDDFDIKLNAFPQSVRSGQTVKLEWEVSGSPERCWSRSTSGPWTGDKNVNGGEETIVPVMTTHFGITCSKNGHEFSRWIRVYVDGADVVLRSFPELIRPGEKAMLQWFSSEAERCWGSDGWVGEKGTSGTEEVAPTQNTHYLLTCKKKNSEQQFSQGRWVLVDDTIPELNFTITSTSVPIGSTVTLNWSTQRASGCVATGGWSGIKTLTGSESFVVNETKTYKLSCQNNTHIIDKTIKVVVGDLEPGTCLTSSDCHSSAGKKVTCISGQCLGGDINGDSKVDIADFALFKDDYKFFLINDWNSNLMRSDLNDDERISIADYTIFVRSYRLARGFE